MTEKWIYSLGLVLICLLAFWLRLPGLFAYSFHADEALFASWARHIASWKDPLLLTQAVDKPPLLFYLQAIFYALAGPVEWAARLPNFMASVCLVPLTAVFSHRLYSAPVFLTQRRRDAENGQWQNLRIPSHHTRSPSRPSRITSGGWLAALIVACSPLAIQFSPTAFTDPLLTFWLLACLSVIGYRLSVIGKPSTDYRSPITSGFLFGLAVATKYQAWLFLPLVLGLGWLAGYGRVQWRRWLLGLLPILAVVFLWEYGRTGTFSLWSAQIGNYGGVRLAWSWELWPRLVSWVRLWATAVPPILYLLLVGLLWRTRRGDDMGSRVDLLLLLFVLAYGGLHWLTAVPVWDRYLLPLVPVVAVLIGRGWQLVVASLILGISADFFGSKKSLQSVFIRAHPRLIFFLLMFFILIFPAWGARYGRYPVGGQVDADQGAAEIAAVLADKPYGTVLYDHWYSWQWGYHLFYRKIYVSWFPYGAALVEDLAVFGRDGNARYVALPDTAVSQPIIRSVQDAGFQLQPVAQAGNIGLYQILPDEKVTE